MQQALAIPWRRRADFARALAIPLALLADFYLLWYVVAESAREASGWTAVFVYWLVFAILFGSFAVTCHRLVLLDARPPRGIPLPILLLWTIYIAVWWIVMLIAGNLLPARGMESAFKLIEIAGRVPALYVIARLSLVFPATAIDHQAGLKWAWHGGGRRADHYPRYQSPTAN